MKYCLVLLFLLITLPSQAAITFDDKGRWETTYNYFSECSQRGNLGNTDCQTVANDGVWWSWGANMLNDHSTEAVKAANNPAGGGGFGARWWNGDGKNIRTGDIRVDFPSPQTELWIRWYQRYESGYGWDGNAPHYDKTLYINTEAPGISALPQHAPITDGNGPGFAITSQAGSSWYQAVSDPRISWSNVFGVTSDGKWHSFEVHIKMDTGGSNGIGQMWIDGKIIIDSHAVNWSNGNFTAQQGWTWMEYHSNQNKVYNNRRTVYVDYDDMVIYNTTPPNRDADGNPWIGEIDEIKPQSPPKAPEKLTVVDKQS